MRAIKFMHMPSVGVSMYLSVFVSLALSQCLLLDCQNSDKKTNSVAFSPQVNYTD
jgi:hypothetical protein